jgi:hypothetical protein
LQAGASKVPVPVRPAYQEAVLHYLTTGGEIWNGEGAPAIGDELYLSIITELQEAANATEGEELEQTWISKVPTSLVMLDPTDPPALPDNTATLLP